MSLFKKSLDPIGPLMGLGGVVLWVVVIGEAVVMGAVLAREEDLMVLVFPLLLLLGVAYGWMLFVYIHYRLGRQDEFLNLLTTVAESGAPLAPALRAYLLDRPRGTLREFWVAVLLFFALPGYYWFWHRRHSYDRKVARVADQLEQGVSLAEALQAAPGVASGETLLAVSVGQATGQVALCLRGSARSQLASAWLEILPRLLYPLLLLFFMSLITDFWFVFLLPKIQRIYEDFGDRLPSLTAGLVYVGDLATIYWWVILLALLGSAALAIYLLANGTVRWYLPVIGRLSRMNVQSRVLQMLGVLLEAGKPVPEALALLAGSGYFAPVARRRLEAALHRVEQGEPLADSLRQEKLLAPSMVPLVQAAGRARNLPWALAQLGVSLGNRTVRLMRRISLVLFPASVVAVGLLAGFIVISMFLPLVELISRLSE